MGFRVRGFGVWGLGIRELVRVEPVKQFPCVFIHHRHTLCTMTLHIMLYVSSNRKENPPLVTSHCGIMLHAVHIYGSPQ